MPTQHAKLSPSAADLSCDQVIWKPIPGYEEFYEISTDGRVRSFDRLVDRSHVNMGSYILPGKEMKLRSDKDGYILVDLNNGDSKTTLKVHRLVLETFSSNPRNLPQVDHINGVKDDNRLCNLRWVTVSENLTNKRGYGKSGFKGVRAQNHYKCGIRYQAYCTDLTTGKFVHIGVYDTASEAFVARQKYIEANDNVSTR